MKKCVVIRRIECGKSNCDDVTETIGAAAICDSDILAIQKAVDLAKAEKKVMEKAGWDNVNFNCFDGGIMVTGTAWNYDKSGKRTGNSYKTVRYYTSMVKED